MTSSGSILVISDTSPINYLVLTGYIQILPSLYGTILIPQAVYEELMHEATPAPVREWMEQRPDWIDILAVSTPLAFNGLDRGEREALSLALELKADLVLIDDAAAREVAGQRGLLFTGTVGVLTKAAEKGLISLPEAFGRLRETSFRVNETLLETVLERDRNFKRPEGT